MRDETLLHPVDLRNLMDRHLAALNGQAARRKRLPDNP
jgi:hypothetical protein